MNNLESILKLLFRRVSAHSIICGDIRYNNFEKTEFERLYFTYDFVRNENEISNLWMFYKDTFTTEDRKFERFSNSSEKGFSVFDALFYYVNQMLTVENNEILCQYKQLLNWRSVTLELSEDLLISAYWASNRRAEDMEKIGFTWRTVIRHNNYQLNQIMERGLAENHFHLFGSAPIFHITWISLMNRVTSSKIANNLRKYEKDRRNPNMKYNEKYKDISLLTQYYQAAFIRILLFSRLTGEKFRIGNYRVPLEDVIFDMNVPSLYVEGKRVQGLDVSILREEWKSHCAKTKVNALECLEDILIKQYKPVKEENFRRKLREENQKLFEIIQDKIGYVAYEKDKFENLRGNRIGLREIVTTLKKTADLDDLKEYLFPNIYDKLFEKITDRNILLILNNPYDMEERLSDLQKVIDSFRNTYTRTRVDNKGLEDYALLGIHDRHFGLDESNDIFSGERWLLYTCLNKIWRKRETELYARLFYAYIVIKENLRAELIQTNNKVGFVNFQKYQDRKDELIEERIFENEAVRGAVRESLLRSNIKSLEIRIKPENTVQKNREYIERLDRIIGGQKDRYFYTVHFIKGTDEKDYGKEYVQCRNYKTRQKAKRQAKALAALREHYPKCGARILGIDAASNEVGCRPEVFGSVFRYLKNHIKVVDDGLTKKRLPQLGATYHVGEEFLDVADGLRAIDEAVNFLNLNCGDRLGHAIALGIDVEDWYKKKEYSILIPKQDYLDNLVWMYNCITQYNIQGLEDLKSFIEKKYSTLFHEIYGSHMDYKEIKYIIEKAQKRYKKIGVLQTLINDRYNFGIFQYYMAWQIRGDEPDLYKHGYFQRDERDYLGLTEYYVNQRFPKDFSVRYMPEVFLLNYYYHFNNKVRREGRKRIEVFIKPSYIKGVSLIQKEMQKRIASKGIAIETNPSSNYLISNFKSYGKHPIFKLYNKGLLKNNEKDELHQLSVSVNTDDLGVFSTSLENEYGFLACAMEYEKDKEGRSLYDRADIYAWIDEVRRMGLDQSFMHKSETLRKGKEDESREDKEFAEKTQRNQSYRSEVRRKQTKNFKDMGR